MCKPPIEIILDGVDWKPTRQSPNADGMPYSTHEGVIDFFGHPLRCYQLNTGQRVFDADDVAVFFGGEVEW